ncbi:MAG: Spy/CpxP family protein refolding chaperone [Terracidiphilus sp.]|nr:Spy/CpxP family protein refolding chaperone [Terracidiphilus sp.]
MIENTCGHLPARRVLWLACVLAASCCVLQAQPDGQGGPPPDGPPPGEMRQQSHGPSVERELKQLTQLLTLTTAQQTQVKVILTDQNQQIEALFNQSKPVLQNGKSSTDTANSDDQRPDWEAMRKMRTAVKAIREDANAKIAETLTDDQKNKFAAWEKKGQKASARQEGEDMPPPPPDGEGGPPPDGGGGAPPGGGGPPGV